MYTLKKAFAFNSRIQASAFLDIVSLYGECSLLGNIVLCRATLQFCVWRKLINLSRILRDETAPDIRDLSSKAGLRLFKEVTLP